MPGEILWFMCSQEAFPVSLDYIKVGAGVYRNIRTEKWLSLPAAVLHIFDLVNPLSTMYFPLFHTPAALWAAPVTTEPVH